MSRAHAHTLTDLFDTAEVGGYTLPAELTDAWRTYGRLKAATVAMPEPLTMDTAAARLVSAAAAGQELDVPAAAAALEQRMREQNRAAKGQELLREAVDQASTKAGLVAADLTEQIIAKHLRPAHDEVLVKTREAAATLKGHSLEPRALITASAKVRAAWASLPTLAQRRQAVLAARAYVNRLGGREPQHDAANQFADLRKPQALHPTWSANGTAPMPRFPWPTDEVARLLWLVGEAAPAEPWLPTVAEQDSAWVALFGEKTERLARNRRNSRAIPVANA